jgi:hypothetical protein
MLRRVEFRSVWSHAGRHHCKSFSAGIDGEAFIARHQKQSWFPFIDWRLIAFTIQSLNTRSSIMLQSDPIDRCCSSGRLSQRVAAG